MHAVLDGEQALGRLGQPTFPALLKEASVHQVLEGGVGLDDAVEGVVLDRGQLLVVTHQRQRPAESQRRKGLIDTGLVGLVEDDDVEVHVGDRRGRRGGAGGEVAVGGQQSRVVFVIATELVDGGMDALRPGHPDGAHSRSPGEPLQVVVDREVAV